MGMALQVVGVVLGLAGWCLQSSCTSSHRWRVRSHVDSVTTSQSMFEGLWMSCVSSALGSTQCSRFKSLLALPGMVSSLTSCLPLGLPLCLRVHIQVCRGLMVVSLLVGLVSLVLSVMGLRCTQLGRVSPQTKNTLTLSGGALFLLAGTLSLVAVSWYASRVVQEFYDSYSGGARFELGAGLYQGWAASGLFLLAGALLCCSYRKEEEQHYIQRFSYKHRAPSPGLPIYSLAPARAGTGTGSSKAYV
ncbi:claudin-19 isoform X1 [Gadus morhua]|uniref:claudin-19 isoform X1 n=1 Tax=Gadus morhua TaxID=8049 RepID=UPI0011B7C825|nr:claudin-1 isoform X1 [Gadus morhua]